MRIGPFLLLRKIDHSIQDFRSSFNATKNTSSQNISVRTLFSHHRFIFTSKPNRLVKTQSRIPRFRRYFRLLAERSSRQYLHESQAHLK